MHFSRLYLVCPLLIAVGCPQFQILSAGQTPPAPAVSVEQSDKQQQSEKSEAESEPDGSRGDASASKRDNDKPVAPEELHDPVLWRDPGNIESLNLFYGQGGEAGQPQSPFVFESEDHNGTNPKFDVRDANGKKWRVKLGEEARPEVVASRLLWAVGYFVNDDYVLASANVQNLHLQRGANLATDGRVTEARFARKPPGQKKIGIWEWKKNPFTGTREFNGLRVMMAVMNNWDLKDVNNAVFYDKKSGRDLFLASDIGASFGTNGLSWTRARSKGNIKSFKESKFIEKLTDTEVDFATPKRPTAFLIKTAGFGVEPYAKRSELDWIGNKIPRQDARWIASFLCHITHQQLIDAFRAGHFPPDQIDAYVDIVESRIRELQSL